MKSQKTLIIRKFKNFSQKMTVFANFDPSKIAVYAHL